MLTVRRKTTILSIVTFIVLAALSGCGMFDRYPPGVTEVLEAAGENRPELEKVIAHYQEVGDSLKLQAAYYLIGNMEDHSYVTYYLHDSSDVTIEFNVTSFADYAELTSAADSIEASRGEIDYDKKDIVKDAETITADFLIKQIDFAFRAWQEKPWAQHLTYEQFREYVLPYRGSNEPLEPWRKAFLDKYESIADSMTDPSDPVQAAVLINDDIKSWFGFDPRWYYHPTDQGLSEMLEGGLGRCEDMTNITIYAMRANGIAVTSDYTPYWANTGNNHAWNAILLRDGSVVPFMGAEANPGKYRLSHKAAKIYRKTFGQQKENLKFQERKQEAVPRWLKGRYYRDVTADYLTVANPVIDFSDPIPDSIDIAYLSVFNSGEWKPINWARVSGNKATFKEMGTDVVYLPTLYVDEENVPVGVPFLLNDDETQQIFLADTSILITARLTSTTKRNQKGSEEGIEKSFLKEGAEYELSYYDYGWQSIGTATATNQPLKFENVPSGGLYWVVEKGADEEERIFSIEDGKQVWW